jgi:hypothetical protein
VCEVQQKELQEGLAQTIQRQRQRTLPWQRQQELQRVQQTGQARAHGTSCHAAATHWGEHDQRQPRSVFGREMARALHVARKGWRRTPPHQRLSASGRETGWPTHLHQDPPRDRSQQETSHPNPPRILRLYQLCLQKNHLMIPGDQEHRFGQNFHHHAQNPVEKHKQEQ